MPRSTASSSDREGSISIASAAYAALGIGTLPIGERDAVTDGDGVRGGGTLRHKLPVAIHFADGWGRLIGSTRVHVLGDLQGHRPRRPARRPAARRRVR